MSAAHLTIDLDAIGANWRALDTLSAPEVETAACVKANGYGLDATRVARALAAAGARTFFVALADEGRAVRQAVGNDADIFVFCGHMPGTGETLRGADLIPMLNSPDQVARHFSESQGQPFGVQLDTGMNRLGMEADDWGALKSELMAAGPRLVMSHLACADEPEHAMNRQQLRTFHEMTDGIAHRRSLAATGGVLLGADYHFDLTRPGIGLYGGLPFSDAKPVARLSAPIIQTRMVAPFETGGYGNAWTADIERRIATISAVYADGLIRAMGPNAKVWAGATPCDIVGRVSMELITIDITHLRNIPETLDFLGPEQTVDTLADAAGTIGYEILTSLGGRYSRRYVGGA